MHSVIQHFVPHTKREQLSTKCSGAYKSTARSTARDMVSEAPCSTRSQQAGASAVIGSWLLVLSGLVHSIFALITSSLCFYSYYQTTFTLFYRVSFEWSALILFRSSHFSVWFCSIWGFSSLRRNACIFD